MPDDAAGRSIELTVFVPPETEGGIYANFLATWHTPYEFTLDFAATQRPEVPDDVEALSRFLVAWSRGFESPLPCCSMSFAASTRR
jgi:hypothetical protein